MRRLSVGLAALLFWIVAAPSARATPDLTPYQWGLQQVRAPAGWQVSTGSGITVGVVDTGADAGHPDFGGRVSTIDCTDTGGSAANCHPGGGDIHGHGTHVTGIVAAANDGAGTAGTAPNARVLVAKVFKCDDSACQSPGATIEDVEAGINWLLDHGVVAINLSLGDGGFAGAGLFCDNSRFATVLEGIWNRGAVPVFAAGNCGGGVLGGGANYSGVHALVVGATGPTGARTGYTNDMSSAMWGLLAPGGDGACNSDGSNCILSTWPRDKSGGGEPYYLLEGTSMAAPHVTGAVADLRARGLSQQGAVDSIMGSLDRVDCGAGCHGRLNLQAALGAPPPPPPPTPSSVPTSGFGGQGGTSTRRGTSRPVAPRSTATVTTAAPTTTTEAPTTTTEPPTTTSAKSQSALKKSTKNDDEIGPGVGALAVAALIAAGGATAVAGRLFYSRRNTVTTLP